MSGITTKTGAYSDLPSDVRVERFYARRRLGAVTADDTDSSFIIAAEPLSNFEDPSVLAGNVVFPRDGRGTRVSRSRS
jgi:hypothetical protein